MSEDTESKEARILGVMKSVLTRIVKDTATQPGLKHPLADGTIEDIRHCLGLIAAREAELAEEAGAPMTARPRYVDEPRDTVVIPLNSTGLGKNKPKS